MLTSVVDRHRFDADANPDPDPTFRFDADPGLDRILPQILHIMENLKNFEFYSQQRQFAFASAHYFNFLFSVIGVKNILDGI